MPVPPTVFLTGISFTSLVKSLVASMTGAPSAAKASTGKAIMMVAVFMASTALLMGSLGRRCWRRRSTRRRTLFSRSSQRTTMSSTDWPG